MLEGLDEYWLLHTHGIRKYFARATVLLHFNNSSGVRVFYPAASSWRAVLALPDRALRGSSNHGGGPACQ